MRVVIPNMAGFTYHRRSEILHDVSSRFLYQAGTQLWEMLLPRWRFSLRGPDNQKIFAPISPLAHYGNGLMGDFKEVFEISTTSKFEIWKCPLAHYRTNFYIKTMFSDEHSSMQSRWCFLWFPFWRFYAQCYWSMHPIWLTKRGHTSWRWFFIIRLNRFKEVGLSFWDCFYFSVYTTPPSM